DNIDEFDETFNVTLTDRPADGHSEIGDGQGVVTILDDDATPSVTINDISVTEGNSGTTNANFTLTLSGPSEKPISFQAATSDGTATTADYTPRTGTLTIPAGQTSGTITVQTTSDTIDEVDETFNLILSSPSEGNLLDPLGIGTIDDDDGPSLSIADAAPV